MQLALRLVGFVYLLSALALGTICAGAMLNRAPTARRRRDNVIPFRTRAAIPSEARPAMPPGHRRP